MNITKNKTTQTILVTIVFVLFMALWELGTKAFQIAEYNLPPPSAVGLQLYALLQDSLFWADTFTTLSEILLGFALSIMVAIIIGPLIAHFLVLELSLLPYIIGFQAIPSIALAPLFFMWLGPEKIYAQVLVVFTVAAFPILMMVIVGLRSSCSEQIQMLRSFGATPLQILKKVQIPNALPHFFTGLRLGIIMSVTGAIVAEFQGVDAGLGARIAQSYEQFLTAKAFAYIFALSIIAILLHTLIGKLRSYVVFWVNPSHGRMM